MRVDVYTVCRNEIKIAHFMVDYWKSLADDVNVFVFDEMSDDGTREFLSQFGFVKIFDTPSEGLNDELHVKIKNNMWKESRGKADLVMVCDFDETISSYDTETLRKSLDVMVCGGYSILAPLSFNLVADSFPEYDGSVFMHKIVRYGVNDMEWYSKAILFDPDKIDEIDYCLGAHCCNPVGDVSWYTPDNLFFIHAKWLGYDYCRDRIRNRNVSKWNKYRGLYAEQEKSDERLRIEYDELVSKRFAFDDIPNNFDRFYKTRRDWRRWFLGII